MSEILVPIAVSSQLDVTGEERIHIAKYVPGGYGARPALTTVNEPPTADFTFT